MTSGGESPAYPVRLNIAARLLDGAVDSGWSERPAFVYRDEVVSYAQTCGAAARCAGALRELGVEPEQRVAIALPDAPPFVAAFLGAMWQGSVAVPINPYLPSDSYEFYLRDSRAVVAVVAPWLVSVVLEAAARLPALRHVVVFADPGTPEGGEDDGSWRRLDGVVDAPRVHSGESLLTAATTIEAAETHCDEAAFWLYTSGSTGSPKGAIHLHHDIWVSADCWGRRTMHMGPEHVHLSASKLFFAYGLGNSLHCPMWTGGRAVLVPEKPSPEGMLASIARHGVTHFYAVPSFYNAVMADSSFSAAVDRGALSSLQVCVSAGETLPAPLCERWMEITGVPLIDGIGSTELLHIFIANRVDDIRPGCSGKPIPGYDARVADEHGAQVEDGAVGDLWVRGDSACAGYWNRHTDSKRAVRGEWFVTGDKYRRDEDGYYWYTGRADDMFKVHGKWVSPAQVESVLLVHDAVREVAVVGSTDEGGLSCAVAYVVPTGPVNGLEQILKEHARQRLSGYLVPERIEVVDGLPKTPTGKIQRYLLRG
jgi:benzoate-CoA ligase